MSCKGDPDNLEKLKALQNQRFIVTIINPHFNGEDPSERPLEKDVFRNPEAYDDISRLL